MSTTLTNPAETEAFSLYIPPPKALTPQEEADLYRQALQRTPESLAIRQRLVGQLLHLDQFDEALELLRTWNSDDFRLLLMEAEALISRESEADNTRCEQVCLRALAVADNDRRRANALSLLGKVQVRLGRSQDARVTLDEALALDRKGKDAWKRSTNLALAEQRSAQVLEQVEDMVAEGTVHSRIIASQSLALAQQGMLDEARASQGLDEFFRHFDPSPPEGWATLAEFTSELAEEIAAHPGLRYGRYGQASTRSWRIDDPGLKRLRVFPLLQELIRREILRYVSELPESDHPFLAGRLRNAELRNWCVVTEGEGHEEWHVHQSGWISGTFYIQVPDHIANGTGKGGCIAFGLPEEVVGQKNAEGFGEVLCRPHAGLMTIFPSHTFHRTYPHGGSGRRICYAFDIIERSETSSA